MKTRKPTFEELFPVAHQQDLLKNNRHILQTSPFQK